MNELEACQKAGPPATVEELTQFLLIAPEKAVAMRAEIRAIKKAGLAKAVYDQKLEEQRRLCDMILDASVRLGEMTRELPKAPANRGNQYTGGKTTPLSNSQKPKSEAVQDLGFSPKQVQRFETLADNKDLVELEKVKAREEGRMPTRTNVIDLARERKKRFNGDMERIDTEAKLHKQFLDAVFAPLLLPEASEVVSAILGVSEGNSTPDLDRLNQAIQKLQDIQTLLRKEAYRNGTK